jgi:hypothetical protein
MEHGKPQPIPEESLKLGYEVRDTNLKPVLWSAIGLALLTVLAFITVTLLYSSLETSLQQRAGAPPPLLQEAQGLPPGALLQRNPADDMTKMTAENETVLSGYGWIDQQAGVVRIPIDRAMELTLERGLPIRPQK